MQAAAIHSSQNVDAVVQRWQELYSDILVSQACSEHLVLDNMIDLSVYSMICASVLGEGRREGGRTVRYRYRVTHWAV
jgi:hypothetical protein